MEVQSAIGLGVFIGWGTLGALLGLIHLARWAGKTEGRVGMLERQFQAWVKLFKVPIGKGVQNENRTMVGAAPAGPKKTC